MLLVWDNNAWEDCLWWPAQDRKVLKRVNLLIQDVQRNGNDGIGKPDVEARLRWLLAPAVTDEHTRLVYTVTDTEVRTAACRYHYGRRGSRPLRVLSTGHRVTGSARSRTALSAPPQRRLLGF